MCSRDFTGGKLVRDQIPFIMRKKGVAIPERVLEHEEFIQKLKDKLVEEAKEVVKAQNEEELLEELSSADAEQIFQVLGILMERGVSLKRKCCA